MTISTMNTKSGTNGILPHRIKHGITHFEEKNDLKSSRESIYSALIWYQIHILLEQISYVKIIFFNLTVPFFYTDCMYTHRIVHSSTTYYHVLNIVWIYIIIKKSLNRLIFKSWMKYYSYTPCILHQSQLVKWGRKIHAIFNFNFNFNSISIYSKPDIYQDYMSLNHCYKNLHELNMNGFRAP